MFFRAGVECLSVYDCWQSAEDSVLGGVRCGTDRLDFKEVTKREDVVVVASGWDVDFKQAFSELDSIGPGYVVCVVCGEDVKFLFDREFVEEPVVDLAEPVSSEFVVVGDASNGAE